MARPTTSTSKALPPPPPPPPPHPHTHKVPSLPPSANKTGTIIEDPVVKAFKSAVAKSPPAFAFGVSPSRPSLINPSASLVGPGAYNIPSTLVGKISDSRFRSNGGFSLRSRATFGSTYKEEQKRKQQQPPPAPAPVRASTAPAAPTTVNPRHRNAPQFSFPKGHFLHDKLRMQPGPGHYRLKASMGTQVLSTKSNAPSSSFGRSRSAGGRQTSDAAGGLAFAGVGPGEYGVGIAACSGQQVDSRKRNNGGIRFGQAPKDAFQKPSACVGGAVPRTSGSSMHSKSSKSSGGGRKNK